MNRNLAVILFLLAFASIAFSQQAQTSETKTKTEQVSSNLLEKVDLRFDLAGTPKPEDVGFDDPKSRWKLAYELRLSDEKTLDKLHSGLYDNCRQNTPDYQKCVSKANKKFDRKLKKSALLIFKGIFDRKDLSIEANRQTLIPISFAPNVVEIFNRAAQTSENPIFILRIKSKVSAKPAGNKKFKRKISFGFIYPLKLIRKDGSFEYHNITAFGASVRIYKEQDGGIGIEIYNN